MLICQSSRHCPLTVPKPSILLKNYLKKKYPKAYKRREEEVKEATRRIKDVPLPSEPGLQPPLRVHAQEEAGWNAWEPPQGPILNQAWRAARPYTIIASLLFCIFVLHPLRSHPPVSTNLELPKTWRQFFFPDDTSSSSTTTTTTDAPDVVGFLIDTYLLYAIGWTKTVPRFLGLVTTMSLTSWRAPSPSYLFSYMPHFRMVLFPYTQKEWLPIFREIVAFVIVESELQHHVDLIIFLVVLIGNLVTVAMLERGRHRDWGAYARTLMLKCMRVFSGAFACYLRRLVVHIVEAISVFLTSVLTEALAALVLSMDGMWMIATVSSSSRYFFLKRKNVSSYRFFS